MADHGGGVGRDRRDSLQQETIPDRAGASLRGPSVVRLMGKRPAAPSGWEWNGLQPGQGAAELVLPRPAPGEMQGQPARRAGESPGQGEEASPEGLGGHYLLAQAEPVCRIPTYHTRLWAITCTASQAALAAKRPEGRWLSPTPYLSLGWRSRSRRGGDGQPPHGQITEAGASLLPRGPYITSFQSASHTGRTHFFFKYQHPTFLESTWTVPLTLTEAFEDGFVYGTNDLKLTVQDNHIGGSWSIPVGPEPGQKWKPGTHKVMLHDQAGNKIAEVNLHVTP